MVAKDRIWLQSFIRAGCRIGENRFLRSLPRKSPARLRLICKMMFHLIFIWCMEERTLVLPAVPIMTRKGIYSLI